MSSLDSADVVAVLQTIIDCNDEGPGLIDCIDNDGEQYTSQALDRAIKRGRAALASQPLPPSSNPTNLLGVIADIRQKSGLGAKPMLSELADEIGKALASHRAQLATAREALEPFAAFAPYVSMFVEGRAAQGGSPILPTKHFRRADFERAAQVHATLNPKAPPADGTPA